MIDTNVTIDEEEVRIEFKFYMSSYVSPLLIEIFGDNFNKINHPTEMKIISKRKKIFAWTKMKY